MDPNNSEKQSFHIIDVVDIDIIQRIQDTFAEAMGVAAVTVDRDGKPITKESNFCKLCLMIRETPEGLERCHCSDAEGGKAALEMGKPYAYKCPGGLLDAAAPIIIEGKHVGSILCGQAIAAESPDDFSKDIVDRNLTLGLKQEDIEEAILEITPLPSERFKAAVEMLSLTANHVIEMSASNLAKSKLLQESEKRALLQASLQDAQIKALKAQINPHFLFNSLTLLGYTALEEDAPRTEEIAYSLSDLLRYSLRNISSTVELQEEMQMLQQYLEMQKIRFGDRLQSEIFIDPGLKTMQVPCMALQPLVENAVIHGAEPLTRAVTISVKAYREANQIIMEVCDDGVGMAPEIVEAINLSQSIRKKDSLGMLNVIHRLSNEYGDAFKAHVESSPGRGTCIRLSLHNSVMN